MQTIASLARRLDMSAEEAVETLRKLHYDIEDVDAEIDDEQTDILIDIDETPSAFDAFLKKVKKEEAAKKRKAERLQKAAKKAAVARKAKKKTATKKTAASKSADEEATVEIAEPEEQAEIAESTKVIVEAPVEEEPVEIVQPAVSQEEAVVEVFEEPAQEMPLIEESEEAPALAATVVEEESEKEQEETPVPEEPVAETPEIPEQEVVSQQEPQETVEILPEVEPEETSEVKSEDERTGGDGDEVVAAILEEEPVAAMILPPKEEEEKEENSAKLTPVAQPETPVTNSRPLATPDPEVVAAVIRKAHERSQQKAAVRARKTSERKGGAGRKPAAPAASIDAPIPGPLPEKAEAGRGAPSGKTARKRKKRAERAKLNEATMRREAAAAVREIQAGGSGKKRRKKQKRTDEAASTEQTQGGVIQVDENITVEQLANALQADVTEVILALMDENIMANKNQVLEMDVVRRLAAQYDYEVEAVIPEEEDLLAEEPDKPEDLRLRAPVVTVMGHVDHGKTSLLDRVRKDNVAEGEAGGITQHIAAYDVEMSKGRVVFLDTPGHEAFTQMRARGAHVTDIVVLVVAADDGVKPQTIEAIDHAKAAEVPLVVAINKIDKPNAQPDRVRQELTQYELVDEAWGGKTIMRSISCKTGEGIEDLMEMLVLEAEMLELKANPNKHARGAIVESELSRGQGPVAWVLVQNGTLHVGDYFLAGESYGRVRTMTNSKGAQVKEVGPSTPVLVTGFSEPPNAGDIFVTTEDERVARTVAEKRVAVNRQRKGPATKHMTLEDFHARMMGVERKQLNIIIKADVQGSVDVLNSSLAKLGNEEVSVAVVHSGVGGINESDIMLASASDAVIVGFHVTANTRVKKIAETEGVEIRTYRVIYEMIDEVRHALEGLLTPDKKEVVLGHAEIRQIFRSSAVGNIAGSLQLDGETTRGSLARLIRDDVVIQETKIATVRREKDEVRSVATGFECGIKLERYDDIQIGDIIETYRIDEVSKTL